ncbi:hypothetical protein [Kibdelosporangium phytohabitans]|nr:hypothetical protein [Kibdelosporangium phytohabitans]MBE1469387.1 hypothetical protein [Kibdelosporangium phytohabitans]
MTAAILVALDLPRLLSGQDAYREVWPQYVTWFGLRAVTAVVAGANWRDKPLGRWRWPLVAVAFAAVLVARYLMTFRVAVVIGQAGLTVAGAVNATWAVLTYQLAIAMIAAILRGLAVTSAKVARAGEQLRTAEAVPATARGPHTAVRRIGGHDSAVVARAGVGRPGSGRESVRRACAVETARMRRLFAEASAVSDPLLHELRACVETAERLDVPVSFAERRTRPALPTHIRRRLTEPTITALASARGKAWVAVTGTDQAVTVSVLAECAPCTSTSDMGGVAIPAMRNGERWWIQATWQLA